MRNLTVAGCFVAVLTLSACAVDPAPPDEPAAGSSQVPIESEAPCIEGSWRLDLDDYVSQSAVYLKSLGIPLESLDAEGEQVLDIQAGADPIISERTDIAWSAVLLGNPVEVQSTSVGHGEWGFGEDEDEIEVDNWFWEVEAEVPGPDAPNIPVIDPSEGVSAECSGDMLTLHTPGAPLVGRFIRIQ